MSSPGIEPTTFRVVAQYLHQLRHLDKLHAVLMLAAPTLPHKPTPHRFLIMLSPNVCILRSSAPPTITPPSLAGHLYRFTTEHHSNWQCSDSLAVGIACYTFLFATRHSFPPKSAHFFFKYHLSCPTYNANHCYSRINSTKSPASGVGNGSEPRMMSQAGRMRELCA